MKAYLSNTKDYAHYNALCYPHQNLLSRITYGSLVLSLDIF